MQSKPLLAVLALILLAAVWSARAHAGGPVPTVYSPIVSYREWELELRTGSQDWARSTDGEQATVLGVGVGVAPRWFTEVVAEVTRTPGRASRVEALEWENILQLTEQGRYWLDAGLYAGYEYNRLEGERELELGPMLQKEVGRSVFNLNLILARHLEPRAPGAEPHHTELDYAAQWRWRTRSAYISPGVQAFGSLGRVDRPDHQGLRAGPALFGEASLGGGRKFAYGAAVLAGISRDAPDLTVKFELEYEFF